MYLCVFLLFAFAYINNNFKENGKNIGLRVTLQYKKSFVIFHGKSFVVEIINDLHLIEMESKVLPSSAKCASNIALSSPCASSGRVLPLSYNYSMNYSTKFLSTLIEV